MAAPIWHDYMSAASDGYCGDFTVPAVLWHGTAVRRELLGRRRPSPTTSLGSGGTVPARHGPGSGGAGISPGADNPQNNPTLFAQPPQAPAGNGGGNGNGGGAERPWRWRWR